MQDNKQFNFQGGNQQIDIEQVDHFEGHQPQFQQDQQYIEILDPNEYEDPGFMFLLQETSISQLEEAMVQNISMFFKREARLYNYIVNLLQLTEMDRQGAPEYINQLDKLLKLFFQIHEIGQHSEFTQILAQQYFLNDFKTGYPFGFLINSDLSLIDLLQAIILSQEINNKENDLFSQIRIYLPRFLIFSINPPKPFVSKKQMKSLQKQIVNKINNELFETNFSKPYTLDLLAFSYLSDPELNFQLFNETVDNLRITLESLLDQKSADQDSQQEIKNILQFFLVFTTNQKILQIFLQINFHVSLYNSIKNNQPSQGINQSSWFKDPLIIEYMVSLIIRIMSSEKVDHQFINLLYADFLLFLKNKQLDLITKVILLILNSQQGPLVPVCFHPKLSVEQSKAHIENFLQNQTKMRAGSTLLFTELLTKNQYDKITQLVQDNLTRKVEKYQQYPNYNYNYTQFNFVHNSKPFTSPFIEDVNIGTDFQQQYQNPFAKNSLKILNSPPNQFQNFINPQNMINPPYNQSQNMKNPPLNQSQNLNKPTYNYSQNFIPSFSNSLQNNPNPLQQQSQNIIGPSPKQPQFQSHQQIQQPPPLQQSHYQQAQQLQNPPYQIINNPPPKTIEYSNLYKNYFPIQSQTIRNINEKQEKIIGSWVHLHSFSASNPYFDSQILTKVLENRTNVFFIFQLVVGQENVKLVCFINQLTQDKKRQNYNNSPIQVQSNESSFYAMIVQDDHFWHVNALDGKPHVLLDIQQHMMQISHHNEPIACINLSNFQQSKFGFPFQKMQYRTQLMDQIDAALQSLECYLQSIEIYTFDVQKESQIEDNFQSLQKNYYKQLNYYYSQLRMQPIHFIPKTVTGGQLSWSLNENINIDNLKENSINDIDVINPVTQELQLQSKQQKPFLISFGQKMDGFVKILDQIKEYLKYAKVEKEVRSLIDELSNLCQIEEFQEYIVQSEGFLQYLLSLVYLSKQEDIKKLYQKLDSLINSKLVELLKEKPYLQIVVMLKYRFLGKIVIKIEQQLNYSNKNPNTYQVWQYKNELLPKNKQINLGKPKGVGYGNDEYNIFPYNDQQFKFIQYQDNLVQKQQKRQEDLIVNKQNDEDAYSESLLNCLLLLLDLESVSIKILECIQQSNVVNLVIKYMQNTNLASLDFSTTFPQIIKIIYCLAQSEMILRLFISKDNICLFRQMESFNQQLKMFIQTDNIKSKNIQEFLELYQYVEGCLYAAKLITIKYISQEQQNGDANFSMHQLYRPFMKRLAVGKCEIKTDADYLSRMKEYYQQINNPSQTKMQKLVSEISTIEENLPIEATNSIFIRYDNDRLDCMRTIIFGASGTPYAHGAFLYDLYFGDDYPQRPPKMKLATTGYGKVRFNPNLYNCGKVCLSLLGTWGDNWIANFSTILQILVSVQSMVMSEYVMFNEPGWESLMGTPEGELANRGYCNFIKIQNIRYAMINQLQNPPRGFEEVIKKSFYLRKDFIKKEIEEWIQQADLPANYNQTQNICNYLSYPQLYKQDLIKIYEQLKLELDKLKFDIGRDFQVVSDQKKREISINFDIPYSQQIQNEVTLMPEGLNINEIDISYNDKVQQRQFDSNDKNLQNLMSRYIGVVGLDAVKKQSESTIFIHTLNGLGIEIAKNIVLSGVKRLILFDSQLVEISDLGSNFYLTEKDLNQRRDLSVLNKLKHLNPYVKIDLLQDSLDELNLNEIQVFVTQNPAIASKVSNQNKLAVVLAQTRNVFVRIVTDFGNEFTIVDKDGEQLSEVNIENISKNVVTLFKNQNHNLTENDLVLIQEVKQEYGIGESYNQVFQIKNVKRQSFELVTNRVFTKYISHGIVYQQKQPIKLQFDRISKVINSFDYYCDNVGNFDGIDQIKRDIIHFCLNTTINYQLTVNWDVEKIKMFITQMRLQNLSQILNFKYKEDVLTKYQEQLLSLLTLLSINTQFQPLCALVGGMAAQEALKAINKKYTPIHQVYVQSFEDVLPFKLTELNFVKINHSNNLEIDQNKYQECMLKFGFKQISNTRYSDLANTIGNIHQILSAEVFVVGAGAIGCELLKNYAMLGVSKHGKIYVTDPDIIENSNLSRQFLFREKHIRKPKSLTAAAVVKQMNPDINIVARLDKVCQETQDIYHNNFYRSIKCVTNALDNVQARLFMDSKCIENAVPLIESGTLGSKGHVQSIIPYVTESYASKQDPEQNNDIPYCTLKMFPESNIHCLEWARDKFEQYFYRKPQALLQLMQDPSPQQQTLDMAIKVLNKYPTTFQQCVQMGRLKFQKLFNQDIIALMSVYPLNSLTKEGKLFWAPPKRCPKPIEFRQEFAFKFVEDFAILTAQTYNIAIPNQYDLNLILQNVQIPNMNIKKNKIQQIVEKQDKNNQLQQMEEEVKNYDQLIQEARTLYNKVQPKLPQPQQFEKDDDTNHHVSFITAATNGRAINYGIQQVDWMWTKLKAGRIIPAMATTTSCIAALQTLELIKILQKSTQHRNTFLNVAIPFMMQSQPGEAEKFQLKSGLSISIWTKLNLKIKKLTEPLQHIVYQIEKIVGEEIISLQQGAKVFYMKQMLPKEEIKRYDYVNSPINKCIQFIDNSSQINGQISNNKSFVVLITLV